MCECVCSAMYLILMNNSLMDNTFIFLLFPQTFFIRVEQVIQLQKASKARTLSEQPHTLKRERENKGKKKKTN